MSKWVYRNGLPAVSTFSIVAADTNGEIGVAVQSKFLSVGAVVPWATANIGAIATQSWANTSFGPNGLSMLGTGMRPEAVLETLLKDDPGKESRQVGIVDRDGRSATYTGSDCFDWAGGIAEPGFACQGNILAGENVVSEMRRAFKETTGPLATRLIAALAGGQRAGGDVRGMQSAALYIVKPEGGYGGFNDRYIDLRVDDHVSPIDELARLFQLHQLYFERSKPDDLIDLSGPTLDEVKMLLSQVGYHPSASGDYDSQTREALKAYFLTENFDDRWTEEAVIDQQILQYMRNQK